MLALIRREFAKTRADRLVVVVWFGLLAAYLARAILFGEFVVDRGGRPLPGDFLALWSAGKMFAAGHPADAYDHQLLRALQESEVGHRFSEFLPWNYPPLFLFVVVVLAQLPYVLAYAGWATGTLAGFGLAMRNLFGDRRAAIAYGGAPACFIAFVIAQTGLFLGALFAAVLLTLHKRPVVSGLLLAALAFKPQFGVLFPVALIAGGYWQVFAVAGAATVAWMLAWLAIDPSVFAGFLEALASAGTYYLQAGGNGFYRIQSFYALLRTLGAGDTLASALHGLLALGCVIAVFAAWRSRFSLECKAAILVLATLLITPYSFIYDFPLLTVAAGFLYREQAFDRTEQSLVWTAYGFEAAYLLTGIPFGLAAVGAIVAIVKIRMTPRGNDLNSAPLNPVS